MLFLMLMLSACSESVCKQEAINKRLFLANADVDVDVDVRVDADVSVDLNVNVKCVQKEALNKRMLLSLLLMLLLLPLCLVCVVRGVKQKAVLVENNAVFVVMLRAWVTKNDKQKSVLGECK